MPAAYHALTPPRAFHPTLRKLLETQGGIWGVLGGHKFKTVWKVSNWHQFWFTSADSYGNGHRLSTIKSPLNNPRGMCVWGSQILTAEPIGPKFGTRLRIGLGMNIG